jgi:hypothetical protein
VAGEGYECVERTTDGFVDAVTNTTINGRKSNPAKYSPVSLAKILSAGQKETEMAGVSERRQIINTQKTL